MARKPFVGAEAIATWRRLAQGHVGVEHSRLQRLAEQLSRSDWANQRATPDRVLQVLGDGRSYALPTRNRSSYQIYTKQQ